MPGTLSFFTQNFYYMFIFDCEWHFMTSYFVSLHITTFGQQFKNMHIGILYETLKIMKFYEELPKLCRK